jgi:hypothetical protein
MLAASPQTFDMFLRSPKPKKIMQLPPLLALDIASLEADLNVLLDETEKIIKMGDIVDVEVTLDKLIQIALKLVIMQEALTKNGISDKEVKN